MNLQTQICASVLGPIRVRLEDAVHLLDELVLIPVAVIVLANILNHRKGKPKLRVCEKPEVLESTQTYQ
jgi:hypothetical protein